MKLFKDTKVGRFLSKTLDTASIFSPQVALIGRAADALIFNKPVSPEDPKNTEFVQEMVNPAALGNHKDFGGLQKAILTRIMDKFDVPFISSPEAEKKFKEGAILMADALAIEISQQIIQAKS